MDSPRAGGEVGGAGAATGSGGGVDVEQQLARGCDAYAHASRKPRHVPASRQPRYAPAAHHTVKVLVSVAARQLRCALPPPPGGRRGCLCSRLTRAALTDSSGADPAARAGPGAWTRGTGPTRATRPTSPPATPPPASSPRPTPRRRMRRRPRRAGRALHRRSGPAASLEQGPGQAARREGKAEPSTNGR
jgi:hypothetical protein